MTDPNVLAKLQTPNGRLQQLLKSQKSDEEILEELFLATVSRVPTASEKRLFSDHRASLAEVPAANEPVKTKAEQPAKKGQPPAAASNKKGKPAAAPVAKQANGRQKAFTDALWALINTREFILNH